MKKIITILIFCSFTNAAMCQTLFGIKAGGQNIYWTGNDVIAPYHTYTGYFAGATANFNIHSHLWGLQTELLYSAEGVKLDQGNIKMTYVSVPIVIQYGPAPGLYWEGGIQPNFLVGAKKSGALTGNGDLKKDFKPFNLLFITGAGYRFDWGLGIGARYNYGLMNLAKNKIENKRSNTISIALFFRFGKPLYQE